MFATPQMNNDLNPSAAGRFFVIVHSTSSLKIVARIQISSAGEYKANLIFYGHARSIMPSHNSGHGGCFAHRRNHGGNAL
jgi:hypothetical protein